MARYIRSQKSPSMFNRLFLLIVAGVVAGALWYLKSNKTAGTEAENALAENSEIVNEETESVTETASEVNTASEEETVVTETTDPAEPKVVEEVDSAKEAQLKQIRLLLGEGRFVDARTIAETEIAKCEKYSEDWFEYAELIGFINTKFINSDLRCPEKSFYVVKPGDALIRIAYRNGTTVEQIIKNNPRLNPGRPIIHPEQTLSIMSGNWRIEASKKHYTLALYNNDKLFKIYKISIGYEGRTPNGEFIISDKIVHPEYRGIPYSGNGDDGNELGTHWMRIIPIGDTPKDLQGYGIHGTWEPDSIGKAKSNGCLRLHNDQVKELFELLPSKLNTVKVYIED